MLRCIRVLMWLGVINKLVQARLRPNCVRSHCLDHSREPKLPDTSDSTGCWRRCPFESDAFTGESRRCMLPGPLLAQGPGLSTRLHTLTAHTRCRLFVRIFGHDMERTVAGGVRGFTSHAQRNGFSVYCFEDKASIMPCRRNHKRGTPFLSCVSLRRCRCGSTLSTGRLYIFPRGLWGC
jgi:hypothetical protein